MTRSGAISTAPSAKRKNAASGFRSRGFPSARADRRSSLDAARLVARLVRQVDFACREADNSIFAVFTETDLRSAHVIARRIASVLKNTMLESDRNRPASPPT